MPFLTCIVGCRIYADNFIYITRMNTKETLEKMILEKNLEFDILSDYVPLHTFSPDLHILKFE